MNVRPNLKCAQTDGQFFETVPFLADGRGP
jgi:hypothetical protein